MTLLHTVVLGIIQGLTEFLPISSSGHLVIVPHLLGWRFPPEETFVFDVLVQIATLCGVVAYFYQDLVILGKSFFKGLWQKKPFMDQPARLAWYLILATIPAGIGGLLLKGVVEKAFNSVLATGFFLLFTALILFIAERSGIQNRSLENITWKDALWIGFFQLLAIFPGISRSGATITCGMKRGLPRALAARFSFLMSIPIMLAAGFIATLDLLKLPAFPTLLPTFIPGFIVSGIVGYLSIRWLLGFLTRHPLYAFAIYCLVAGVIAIITANIGSG